MEALCSLYGVAIYSGSGSGDGRQNREISADPTLDSSSHLFLAAIKDTKSKKISKWQSGKKREHFVAIYSGSGSGDRANREISPDHFVFLISDYFVFLIPDYFVFLISDHLFFSFQTTLYFSSQTTLYFLSQTTLYFSSQTTLYFSSQTTFYTSPHITLYFSSQPSI